jgi:signal peptidase I
MSSAKNEKHKGRRRAAEIANTFEWLITAFVLAFLFRAFVMEAFRIPTGSMADTLKGAHFRLRCRQCGYSYDYGFVQNRYGLPRDYVPIRQARPVPPPRCPSCGYIPRDGGVFVANGDRILVLKCIYQFFEPRQWDVVVFKNPPDPAINYIKRLVGRPGETVEIIDGDVYINGLISTKPPKVQDELWMVVYDNDYQPVRPEEPRFNRQHWQPPFRNLGQSAWSIDDVDPSRFVLDSPPDRIDSMFYDTSQGNDFRATYAYDEETDYILQPYCSDLMVRLYARFTKQEGQIGASLSKYETVYRAWVDMAGEMVLARVIGGTQEILESKSITPETDKPVLFKFANVDHRLMLEFGSESIQWDMGREPNAAGPRMVDIQPQVQIFGAGNIELSHAAIYRDIHYSSARRYHNGTIQKAHRASEDNPLKLGKDEFFVLGDNSPNSEDGRWWDAPGINVGGEPYRAGIVPRDYLVGKALFVYWPSGYRPHPNFPLGIIPNVGGMKFIYGGSNGMP